MGILLPVELRLLRYFIAVAQELHFTRAAARLHVAQPALSRQIRKLEASLGTKLFFRSKRWVKLSDAGAVLLPQAIRLIEEADAAARAAVRAGKGEIGTLEVGFTSSTSGDLLPRAVSAYRRRFPGVEIRLREAITSEQVRMLMNDEIHVGLIQDLGVPPALAVQRLRREPLVVALHRAHRLAARTSVAIGDLADEPFILGPGESALATHPVGVACAAAGFAPRIAEQATDSVTRLVLVASGIGVSLLPASSRHLATREIAYRPIRGRPVTMDLLAAWRRIRVSPLTSAFVEVLKNVST
jgi:DNA-binding transcriptional LysR family regulator